MAGTIVTQRLTDDRNQHKSAPLVDVFIPRVKVRDVGVGVVCARMPRQRSVRQWMSYPQAHSYADQSKVMVDRNPFIIFPPTVRTASPHGYSNDQSTLDQPNGNRILVQ